MAYIGRGGGTNLAELISWPIHFSETFRRIAAATRLKESREIELAALTLPEARQAIERRGIELVSYRDA